MSVISVSVCRVISAVMEKVAFFSRSKSRCRSRTRDFCSFISETASMALQRWAASFLFKDWLSWNNSRICSAACNSPSSPPFFLPPPFFFFPILDCRYANATCRAVRRLLKKDRSGWMFAPTPTRRGFLERIWPPSVPPGHSVRPSVRPSVRLPAGSTVRGRLCCCYVASRCAGPGWAGPGRLVEWNAESQRNVA